MLESGKPGPESIFDKPVEIKTNQEYFAQDLQEDLDFFTGDAHAAAEKVLRGENLDDKEQAAYNPVRNQWWEEKYGFPYKIKSARREVLKRKHGPSERSEEAGEMLKEFSRLTKESDQKKLLGLKKKYEEQFPDEIEEIEVLFGWKDFLMKNQKLEKERESDTYEQGKEAFQELTEYQFLFTHFILLHQDDQKFLSRFWEVAKDMADSTGNGKSFDGLRRGIISQVAVHSILEKLGRGPKLSHPSEDAFDAIDLWTGGGRAVQVAGWKEDVPALLTAETTSFPAAQTGEGKEVRLWNAENVVRKNKTFVAKVKKYGRHINKDIQGYMLVIPNSEINVATGKPKKELIEFFRKEIQKAEEGMQKKQRNQKYAEQLRRGQSNREEESRARRANF
ncbi:hypothetical protein ACFL2D_02400 [Patescibacteria group bacterium]